MSQAKSRKNTETSDAKPFLKWAGGKWKLMPSLQEHLPISFGDYYEPFMGSAAFFFWMKTNKRFTEGTNIRLFDLNDELVNCFQQVQGKNYKALITLLEEHERLHLASNNAGITGPKHYYYSIRDKRPAGNRARAARFIYLNRTCFNGLWRVNRSGAFNVPMGRYKNPAICNAQAITAAHNALRGVTIEHAPRGYLAIENDVKENDLVYLDPPYVPLTKTAAFTSYTSEGFSPDDQDILVKFAKRLARKGAKVLISNSANKTTEGLYSDPVFRKHYITARRAIGRNVESRITVKELVVRTYDDTAKGKADR